MEQKEKLIILRKKTGLGRKAFADYLGIPYRTIQDWELGNRHMPEYLLRLITYRIQTESISKTRTSDSCGKNVLITTDESGNQLVVLPQILFKGKKSISWKEVEKYLLRYVGQIFQVSETDDFIYIDKKFSDEYTGSEYTRKLKGALPKVKANMSQGIPEMIEIATDKRWQEDFKNKHGNQAGKGWYRYNTRFALPVMSETGEIVNYNIYQAVLIIRYSSNEKLYLYDIQNIKKETSYPSRTHMSDGQKPASSTFDYNLSD